MNHKSERTAPLAPLSSMGTLCLTDIVSPSLAFLVPSCVPKHCSPAITFPGLRSSMGVDTGTVAGTQDGLSNLGVVSLGGKKFQRPDHGHGFAASARRVFRTKFR